MERNKCQTCFGDPRVRAKPALRRSPSRRLKKIRKENLCWCTARNSGSEAHEKWLELKLWNAGEYPVNDLGCILFMFYDNAI